MIFPQPIWGAREAGESGKSGYLWQDHFKIEKLLYIGNAVCKAVSHF